MRYKLRDSENNIYDIDTDFEEDEDIELEKVEDVDDSEDADFDEADFAEDDLTFNDGLDEVDDAEKNNFAKKEEESDDDEEEVELEEEVIKKGEKEEKPAKKPNGLESDEIDALKQLAKIAPELLALVQTKKPDKKKVVEKDEIEVKKAEEEAPVEDSADQVICDDSRKAFGSIELHKKASSFDEEQAKLDEEIAKAWDNRASRKKQ